MIDLLSVMCSSDDQLFISNGSRSNLRVLDEQREDGAVSEDEWQGEVQPHMTIQMVVTPEESKENLNSFGREMTAYSCMFFSFCLLLHIEGIEAIEEFDVFLRLGCYCL